MDLISAVVAFERLRFFLFAPVAHPCPKTLAGQIRPTGLFQDAGAKSPRPQKGCRNINGLQDISNGLRERHSFIGTFCARIL
ncbi:MAG: hypothetical protein M0Q93_09480, partial [Terrimicrobiaceae bacterium]|nr:hypothetical protein [Terrimicrobiaceae bacterium]